MLVSTSASIVLLFYSMTQSFCLLLFIWLCRNLTRRIVSALPSPYGDSLKAGNFKASLSFLLLGLGFWNSVDCLMLEKCCCRMSWYVSEIWVVFDVFSGLSSNVSGNKDPRSIAPRSSLFYSPPPLDYVFTIVCVTHKLDWLSEFLVLIYYMFPKRLCGWCVSQPFSFQCV